MGAKVANQESKATKSKVYTKHNKRMSRGCSEFVNSFCEILQKVVDATRVTLPISLLNQAKGCRCCKGHVNKKHAESSAFIGQKHYVKKLLALKNPHVSVESPFARDLGVGAGVYRALAVLAYVNGASSPVGSLSGVDVPGLILARKAAVIALIAGAHMKFHK
ncbi:hypothetical protein CTI12_AA048640 [Artemisia annua]|uniref:Uncharacterized protein n=1 Tax=Artemisia annua TaxID=35608 RepID=A0A2U1QCF2_ARTAN|nr:hypothetical protein CTI12_AA048640 [Artemisia annua]